MHKSAPLSRRSMLAGMAAAVPAAAVAAPFPAGQDAALAALFARWQAKRAEIDALPRGYTDEEVDGLVDQLTDIEVAIHETPAETLRGAVLKAVIAKVYLGGFYCDDLMGLCFHSMIADIERLAGTGAAHV